MVQVRLPLLIVALALIVPPVHAESELPWKLVIVDEVLPDDRRGSAAAWVGDSAYVLGGANTDAILRFTRAEELQVTPHRLPMPVAGATAFAVGQSIYLVGGKGTGWADGLLQTRIVRFDPLEGRVVQLDADLAAFGAGRVGASSVHDGTYAWILGGCERVAAILQGCPVLRFDPATQTLAAFPPFVLDGVHWPGRQWGGAALVDDQVRYAGGLDPVTLEASSDVFLLDRGTGTLTEESSLFGGNSVAYASTLPYQGKFMMYGGKHATPYTALHTLDTRTDELGTSSDITWAPRELPHPSDSTSAVLAPAGGYIFGGGPQGQRIYCIHCTIEVEYDLRARAPHPIPDDGPSPGAPPPSSPTSSPTKGAAATAAVAVPVVAPWILGLAGIAIVGAVAMRRRAP